MIFERATIDDDTAERFAVHFRVHDGMVKTCLCLMIPLIVIFTFLSFAWVFTIILGSVLVLCLFVRIVFWVNITIDNQERAIHVESNFPVANPLRTCATISFENVLKVLVHDHGPDKVIWLDTRECGRVIVTRGVAAEQAAIITDQIGRRTGAPIVEQRVETRSRGALSSNKIRF
ncbi:MAG: hypothetical protein JW839_14730 [Candidatus Lokiarchaeota archaeon]|nr:hypothetical protein [Candidatus Lokiarchaeota archaeon]